MLLCCGLTTLDVTQVVERLPGSNEKITGLELRVDFGGPAANAAATAAALGVPTTLLTAVGSGPIGQVVRAQLAAAGVRLVDLLEGQDVDPPVSTVLVTAATGERAVVSVNDTRPRELAPTPEAVLDGVGMLLLDGRLLAVALPLASAARQAGVRVVLDGGSWKPGTAELLAQCDAAVVSADFHLPPELSRAGGPGSQDELARIAFLGPALVARSTGAGPIAVRYDDVETEVEVPAASRVVDTLGAGDVLHGAFAAAWEQGLTEPRAALGFAARVATASVERPGARGWVAEEQVRSAFVRELAGAVSAL